MKAVIYKPARKVMQSGAANTKEWLLEAAPKEGSEFIEPLMGWTGSSDMAQEVRLYFETLEEAIGYAESEGMEFEVIEPKERKIKIQSYADNFKFRA